jgi:hypothetical protein
MIALNVIHVANIIVAGWVNIAFRYSVENVV